MRHALYAILYSAFAYMAGHCLCYYRYFRFCIKRILDHLIQARFQYSLVTNKKQNGENGGKIEPESKNEWQSSGTVDKVLQEKKDIAKDHLVTNNRNWGKMSPMMLAAKTNDRDIIAHDLCWKVICKVWRNGRIQQADIFAHLCRYS